jgi:hypothetical protein
MLELNVKIGSKDLYDYALKHSYSNSSGLIGSCLGALSIVLAFHKGEWAFLVFGIFIMLYLPVSLYIRTKKEAQNNPEYQKEVRAHFDEKGMTIKRGSVKKSYRWEELPLAVSTSRSIIVYTAKNQAMIFPKQQLGDKKAGLIEVISKHMAPSKVKIKE